jgi:hypothetical protein
MIHPRTAAYCVLAIGLALNPAFFVAPPPQPAVAQQNIAKTTLITLGTQGGPLQNKNRSQPANVLIVDNEPYVIDAGNGPPRPARTCC